MSRCFLGHGLERLLSLGLNFLISKQTTKKDLSSSDTMCHLEWHHSKSFFPYLQNTKSYFRYYYEGL